MTIYVHSWYITVFSVTVSDGVESENEGSKKPVLNYVGAYSSPTVGCFF
jgi:hypothetical protein